MKDSKLERQLNLFFLLLNSRRPILRSEIKSKISDYKNNNSDKAFERMFERDKDDLRRNGIKITTINADPLFEDEVGYILDKETFISKEIELNDEEKIVISYSLNLMNNSEKLSSISSIFQKIGVINSDFIDLDKFHYNNERFKIFNNILLAVFNRLELNILYLSSHADSPDWKTVRPYSIDRRNNEIYIDSEDVNDNRIKSYRISNVVDSELTKTTFIKRNIDSSHLEETKKVKIKVSQNIDYYLKILNGTLLEENILSINVYNVKAAARNLLPHLHVIEAILDSELKSAVENELIAIKEALNG